MATWNLADIKAAIRRITASPSTDQLSDADLKDYIDKFYQFTLPNELKINVALQPYSFRTFKGKLHYTFPSSSFYSLIPEAYVDGYKMVFYQDYDLFYQDNVPTNITENLTTGDGGANFSGTFDNIPVVRGTLLITDGTEVFTDDTELDTMSDSSTLTGSAVGTGTITYSTGAWDVTFNAAPTTGIQIYAKFNTYTNAKPTSILLFDNMFTLWPPPDEVYNIKMKGNVKFSSITDTTILAQLGPCISYGTSIDIFAERGQMEHYAEYMPIYQRYKDMALDSTTEELTYTNSIPRF